MVETPAAAMTIEDFIAEGLDFVSFGTNDLTQYTLAIDRNNEKVADLYTESHPAVLKLIERVIVECNKAGVKTSICGQAGSIPSIVENWWNWESLQYQLILMQWPQYAKQWHEWRKNYS